MWNLAKLFFFGVVIPTVGGLSAGALALTLCESSCAIWDVPELAGLADAYMAFAVCLSLASGACLLLSVITVIIMMVTSAIEL